MGVHEFDTLRWLTGQELASVVGLGDPDTVGLIARMSGGATGVITLTRRHPPGDLCRVEVVATEGVRAVAYLDPPHSERQLVTALRAQAEGFAAALGGSAPQGADGEDAAIALDGAERAAAALETAEEALA
jgi:myo-inositol 2-dehydrogenase/D-chiro-inositol 1-dehydrogenase